MHNKKRRLPFQTPSFKIHHHEKHFINIITFNINFIL